MDGDRSNESESSMQEGFVFMNMDTVAGVGNGASCVTFMLPIQDIGERGRQDWGGTTGPVEGGVSVPPLLFPFLLVLASLVLLALLPILSACGSERGAGLRPPRLDLTYLHVIPRATHFEQDGFCLWHLTFEAAHATQLSRSLGTVVDVLAVSDVETLMVEGEGARETARDAAVELFGE